jgi:hypothetical protein
VAVINCDDASDAQRSRVRRIQDSGASPGTCALECGVDHGRSGRIAGSGSTLSVRGKQTRSSTDCNVLPSTRILARTAEPA